MEEVEEAPAAAPVVAAEVAPADAPVVAPAWSGRRAAPSTLLMRGLFLRCPRCGQKKILQGYFKTPPPCPTCGLDFNPDGDAAVGWIIVNLGATMIIFFLTAFLGIVVTWPKVPWTGLTVGTVLLNLTVPFLLTPFSRTIWAGIFVLLHRMDGSRAGG